MAGLADFDDLSTLLEGDARSGDAPAILDIDGDGLPDAIGEPAPAAAPAETPASQDADASLTASVDSNGASLADGLVPDVATETESWAAPAPSELPSVGSPHEPADDLNSAGTDTAAPIETSPPPPVGAESIASEPSAQPDAMSLPASVEIGDADGLGADDAGGDVARIGLIIWDKDVDGDGFTGDDSGEAYSGYEYGSYDFSGYWSDSAGDVNGDGFDDYIVTSYSQEGDVYSSTTYVVFGDESGELNADNVSTLTGSDGFRIDGASDAYGYTSAVAAGDVNGDGFDDLLVGTYGSGASGAAHVVFGSADGFPAALDVSTLDASGGFRIEGLGGDENSSWSTSAGGDVNGDGFADIVVDVWRYSADSYSYSSYVVLGGADGFGDFVDIGALDGTNGYEVIFEEPNEDDLVFVALPYEPCVCYPVDEDATVDLAVLRVAIGDDLLV